jgi:hypothetical protein
VPPARHRWPSPLRPTPAPVLNAAPAPAAEPPTDAVGRLALAEFVAGLLAAGSVAEVEVTIAGATVVSGPSRARQLDQDSAERLAGGRHGQSWPERGPAS